MKDFTEGKISKTLIPFLIPMIFNNLISQLYSYIDTAILGHYVGKTALSAAGGIFPITFVIFTVVIGYQVGATTLIAKYFSLKDYENVNKVVYTILLTMTIFGIFVSIFGYIFTDWLLNLISLPAEVRPMAKIYFRVLMLSSVFSFNYYAVENILQALGNSKVPMYLTMLFSITNIFGDFLFVVGFHWGVFGAALSTLISLAIAFFVGLIYLKKRVKIIDLRFKIFFDKKIFFEISKIGLPTVGQMLGISTSIFIGQNLVNRFGVNIIAANTVGGRISSTIKIIGVAVSSALTTYVSQNYAKHLYNRIKKAIGYAVRLMLSFAVILTAISLLFPEPILKIFTTDEKVISLGKEYLQITAPFYFVFASSFVFTGLMRGVGKTTYTMAVSLISLWGVKLLFAILLAYKINFSPFEFIPINYRGLWWAYVISNVSEAGAYLWIYLNNKWK